MMPTTTLSEIKKHSPCESGWKKLLKNLGGIQEYGEDTPVTLLQILDSNGLADALWAVRACGDERFTRLLACDYAEHVLHLFEAEYPEDKRPQQAIEVSRKYANGKATSEESDAAWAAARDAAWAVRDAAWAARASALAAGDAARAAAGAAAWAARAAAWDAAGAVRDAARDAAWAARASALAAAGDARDAAWAAALAAAWAAEKEWQEEHLRALLMKENK